MDNQKSSDLIKMEWKCVTWLWVWNEIQNLKKRKRNGKHFVRSVKDLTIWPCNDLNFDLWPWRWYEIKSHDLLLVESQGQRSTFGSLHGKNLKYTADCTKHFQCLSSSLHLHSVSKELFVVDFSCSPGSGSCDLGSWEICISVTVYSRVYTLLQKKGNYKNVAILLRLSVLVVFHYIESAFKKRANSIVHHDTWNMNGLVMVTLGPGIAQYLTYSGPAECVPQYRFTTNRRLHSMFLIYYHWSSSQICHQIKVHGHFNISIFCQA